MLQTLTGGSVHLNDSESHRNDGSEDDNVAEDFEMAWVFRVCLFQNIISHFVDLNHKEKTQNIREKVYYSLFIIIKIKTKVTKMK